ncbi:MAG: CDP-alcohol phosphatidyltransferase family protein [Candidatus Bipolaricaulaceae bacterium]
MQKRRLPDLLTAGRIMVALAIVGLIPAGPRALGSVAVLLLLGWTTDMFDGRLARRLDKEPSWIGEHEFQIDMLMVLSSAVFLVATGLVPTGLGLGYLAVAVPLATFAHSRFEDYYRFKTLTMLLAVPWVFAPFVVAYFHQRPVAYVGLVWGVLALAADWRRFTGVVGDFLAGARGFLRRS